MGKGEKNRKVFEREAEGNTALRIWKDCAAAGWFHRLGLGWRTSEYEVHIWWLLDQVVDQHSDNNRAQLSRGGIVRNEQVRPARIVSGERRLTIHTDASAALSIAYRSGAGGRTRHVKVQYLWVQGTVSRKDLRVAKVGTSENPADMLTKFLSAESLGRRSKNVGFEFPIDNFQVLKARDNVAACSELEVRFKNFAKHLGIARAQEGGSRANHFLEKHRGSLVL